MKRKEKGLASHFSFHFLVPHLPLSLPLPCRIVMVVYSERPNHGNSAKMGQKEHHKIFKKGKQS